MKKLFTKGRIALLVIFSVLIIDQIIKVWIKTHMYWHESIRVTDWISPKTTGWLSVWKSSASYS